MVTPGRALFGGWRTTTLAGLCLAIGQAAAQDLNQTTLAAAASAADMASKGFTTVTKATVAAVASVAATTSTHLASSPSITASSSSSTHTSTLWNPFPHFTFPETIALLAASILALLLVLFTLFPLIKRYGFFCCHPSEDHSGGTVDAIGLPLKGVGRRTVSCDDRASPLPTSKHQMRRKSYRMFKVEES